MGEGGGGRKWNDLRTPSRKINDDDIQLTPKQKKDQLISRLKKKKDKTDKAINALSSKPLTYARKQLEAAKKKKDEEKKWKV